MKPIGIAALALALATGAAWSHDGAKHETPAAGRARAVTLQGELVDPQCWFVHDSRGKDHASCAKNCARGGQALSFLDEATGHVYPIIAARHGKDPNDGLYPHIGNRVRVKGTTFTKGGQSVLLVQSIAAVR